MRYRKGMLGPWLTLAAILVVAASAGYTLYRVARPGITDSVWFWLFAFSATGLIGLLAVSPKYDDRQKRLEARYEARSRVVRLRTPRLLVAEVVRLRIPTSNTTTKTTSASRSTSSPRALLLASLTTGYMLLRNTSPTPEP